MIFTGQMNYLLSILNNDSDWWHVICLKVYLIVLCIHFNRGKRKVDDLEMLLIISFHLKCASWLMLFSKHVINRSNFALLMELTRYVNCLRIFNEIFLSFYCFIWFLFSRLFFVLFTSFIHLTIHSSSRRVACSSTWTFKSSSLALIVCRLLLHSAESISQ